MLFSIVFSKAFTVFWKKLAFLTIMFGGSCIMYIAVYCCLFLSLTLTELFLVRQFLVHSECSAGLVGEFAKTTGGKQTFNGIFLNNSFFT